MAHRPVRTFAHEVMKGHSFQLWPLVFAFSSAVACFMGSTVYSQGEEQDIGALSESLSGNAMPSIEHLAAARTEIRHVQALARSYLATGNEEPLQQMTRAQRTTDAEIDEYLRLPVYRGEREIWKGIREALEDMNARISTLQAFAASGDSGRAKESVTPLVATCERAVGAVLADIEFNSRNGEDIARRIGAERSRSRVVAIALDVASGLLTALVALLALRAAARHMALLRGHNQLLARRADELEQFAGRVAHDVKNPIGAAMFSLSLVRRASVENKKVDDLAMRGTSSLQRAARILDGLLAFARAGAQPSGDARAEVRDVVDGLLPDLRSTADEFQVELIVDELPNCAARCDPSILEVLVSNLVRNAIKYIGSGPRRMVRVRGRDLGTSVRVEVEDTGVGIPDELRDAIFEPFVRGTQSGPEGIGLGLATVKRMCAMHGGRVGVESRVGEGSLFWFELPGHERERPRDGVKLCRADRDDVKDLSGASS